MYRKFAEVNISHKSCVIFSKMQIFSNTLKPILEPGCTFPDEVCDWRTKQ